MTNEPRTRRMLGWMMVALLLAGTAAACGGSGSGDDGASVDTTAAAGASTDETGGGGSAEVEAYCADAADLADQIDAYIADPSSGDEAALTQRGVELSQTAADLISSAGPDDQARLEECTQALSGAADAAEGGSAGGTFSTGSATIVTPSETINLALDSGSFSELLGPNGSISVLWADSEQNNVGILGDGSGGYDLSVGGSAAPNGITQNDCTATVTQDEAAGVEGTYTCGGDITGTFEAH